MTDDREPLVSVVMTVYNDARHVGAAIESVLTQTLVDFELLIVDDGSSDGTPDILSKYAGQDARIKIHRQANAGTTAAANAGLSLARGKYVARLDSDDISYPHRLQTEVDFLERNSDVALVGGGSDIIDSEGRVIGVRNIVASNPARALLHRCIYQQSDVMFCADVVAKLGGYRDKLRNAQDYDLWLRISEVAQVAKLTVALGQWRLNPGGYTLARIHEQKREVKIIKQFARQRRAAGRDDYASYHPPEPLEHRRSVGPAQYEWTVVLVLLQSSRFLEAREKIKRLLQTKVSAKYLLAYVAASLPRSVLSLVFRARNWYLNNWV